MTAARASPPRRPKRGPPRCTVRRLTAHDEDLARRVYSYFIFRLRQPEDAERLTRLSFERLWREARLSTRG